MALSQRHHWVISKIVSAFEPEVDNVKVQGFVRRHDNAELLKKFFAGESPDQKLFVFHQPQSAETDDDPTGFGTESPAELYFGQGTTPRLTAKCCVFVRSAAPGVALDLTKQSTPELLFCELSATALGAISTYLDGCFVPAFAASDQWGRATTEQRGDFTGPRRRAGCFLSGWPRRRRRSARAARPAGGFERRRFVRRGRPRGYIPRDAAAGWIVRGDGRGPAAGRRADIPRDGRRADIPRDGRRADIPREDGSGSRGYAEGRRRGVDIPREDGWRRVGRDRPRPPQAR